MSLNNVKLSGSEKSKRGPRVNGVQKKLLVKMIENYFIRKKGHSTDVNFETIETRDWSEFANILNRRGPPKTPLQWKNCFYYMKNRIRKSVDLIRECDASISSNLSEMDLKIYAMASTSYFGTSSDKPRDPELNNLNLGGDEEFYNSQIRGDGDRQLLENDVDGGVQEDVPNSCEEHPTHQENGFEFQNFGYEGQSACVLVADTPEELEDYMNASIIVSDEEEHVEDECIDTEDLRDVMNVHDGNRLLKRTNSAKGGKIPEIQKERLVQLVQNNFLKAFGRFSAVNGKHAKAQLWRDIANELNTLGPHRTGEQWKTTFDNIKASAKAKLADDHNNIDGTIHKPLTRLEEKVLSIYGIDNLDGNQGLGEGGFQYDETVPAGRRAASSTSTQKCPQSTVENNGFNQTDSFTGADAERACQGNASMYQSQNDYADIVLEEILREIREEHAPVDNSVASHDVVQDSDNQSVLGEESTHGRNSRLSFVSHASAASPRRSFNNVNSGLHIRGSEIGTNQSEMQNIECSSSGRGTSANRARVSQNANNEFRIRASSVSCTRGGSSSSARGRFSTITSIRRSNGGVEKDSDSMGRGRTSLQGSQNRVRGVPRLRGSSSSTRGRFSPVSNIQQYFNDDYDEDERVFENSRHERANGSEIGTNQSEMQNIECSSSGRGTSANRARVSQNANNEFRIRASSVSCSQNITRGGSSSSARGRFSTITSIRRSNEGVEKDSDSMGRGRTSLQGSQNRVRGVPRLRGSSSSTRGRFSPVSNIQQYFNDDYDEDERVFENSRHERANGSTVAVVDKAARDRSSLRHRHTSYEMVTRSIDAQEEFIEQDMRNHSEVMYVTERNHSELLGIFNSTLSTIADIAQGFVSRM